MNAQTPPRSIPAHLTPYLAEQEYDRYTPIDQASWRYILRVGAHYFARTVHRKYLDGLVEAGISTERIPRLDEMNQRLSRFGWQAVAVSGFIPPQVFMEFQSLGVMPIACDMRKPENLAYTPAPDIVHEAAGHAPMVADPDYRRYLLDYGEVSRKAIFSRQDIELYDAIREISEAREDPAASAERVLQAERGFEEKLASISWISEATELSRMYWWTVEYGLVGEIDDPRIYGAGLLSSMGESYLCLDPTVRRVPLTVDCVAQEFDITRPQPQLFVTPDFPHLRRVLDRYADRMAFRVGGTRGLRTALRAGTVTTTELDSGLQISGVLADIKTDAADAPIYLRWAGAVQLAEADRQLDRHGVEVHALGFGSPVGPIRGMSVGPGALSPHELRMHGFVGSAPGRIEFESGVVVEGRLTRSIRGGSATLVLTFEDCTVTLGDEILFQPDWGTFDMACGTSVPSVFGGPADRTTYPFTRPPRETPRQKSNQVPGQGELLGLYARVRTIRESDPHASLDDVARALDERWPEDWLLRLELLELATDRGQKTLAVRLHAELESLAEDDVERATLIQRGLSLL